MLSLEHCATRVGGDALGGVHCDGVAEAEVFPDVVVIKDDAGFVVEALGRNMIRLRIDCGDPPSVAVAHGGEPLSVGC